MPRANRHFLPNYIWHITHRCHKQEFLLKFARDRRRWMYWLSFRALCPELHGDLESRSSVGSRRLAEKAR